MKKVITILAVLIVLVGAVFAVGDETHTIKVKAQVSEIVPVFALKQSTNYITNTATLKQGSTTEYTTQFGKKASYGMTEEGQAISAGFQLDTAGSIVFQAVLLNNAKQNQAYTLEFDGGVFDVSRQGSTQNQTYGPSTITTDLGSNITGLTITEGAQAAHGTATNKKVVATFDGKTVAAGTNHVIASATFAYPGDSTIDPTASDEYYYADVTLTISAN